MCLKCVTLCPPFGQSFGVRGLFSRRSAPPPDDDGDVYEKSESVGADGIEVASEKDLFNGSLRGSSHDSGHFENGIGQELETDGVEHTTTVDGIAGILICGHTVATIKHCCRNHFITSAAG